MGEVVGDVVGDLGVIAGIVLGVATVVRLSWLLDVWIALVCGG